MRRRRRRRENLGEVCEGETETHEKLWDKREGKFENKNQAEGKTWKGRWSKEDERYRGSVS